MPRFYVHFEGSPEHTHLAKVAQDSLTTVAALKEDFARAYNTKHGVVRTLDAVRLELTNEKQRTLNDKSLAVKAIADRADVFVVERSSSAVSKAKPLEKGARSSKQAKVSQTDTKSDIQGPIQLSNPLSATLSSSTTHSHAPDSDNSHRDSALSAASNTQPSTSAVIPSSVKGEKSEKADANTSTRQAAVSSAAAARAASEQSLSVPVIRALLSKGLEAQDAQNFRQAAKCFEDVLRIVPKQKICLRGLASMALAVGKYQRAKKRLTEALEIYPDDAGFRTRLGDAFLGLQQYEDAVRQYAIALQLLERRPSKERDPPATLQNTVTSCYPSTNFQMGIPYYLLNKKRERRGDAGDVTSAHAGDLRGAVTENEVRCGMVRALYKGGAREPAANLVTRTLEGKETNFGMLYEYALIAADNGMLEDAMRALLKLLVVRQDHRTVRESLAALVRRPGGFEMLQRETGGGAGEPAAQAFMAGILKDYGLVREAAALYGRAAALAPRSVSYALNWLHALELCNEPVKALEVARNFCRNNRHLWFGRALSLQDALDSFEDLPLDSMDAKPHPGFTVFRNYDVEAFQDETASPDVPHADGGGAAAANGERSRSKDESHPEGEGSDAAVAPEASLSQTLVNDGEGGKRDAEVEEIESPGALRARLAAQTDSRPNNATSPLKEPLAGSSRPAKINYSPEQLDGLAVLFTVVKILYLGGAAGRARQLAQKVEKARALSEKPLHETMIRNEAAYFGCIYQVFTEYPLPVPLPPVSSAPPLYLVGDSHCLTPAWRSVELRGAPRLLTPLLVTGLKCWHLRDESVFYPKIQFQNVVASLPQNAQVIMMFGEIDCREGIVVSVDKGRYKDLEEGVTATVNIYIKVLRRLVSERGFEIFVHPPPTILDETRSIVRIFARVLKRKVLAASRVIEESKSGASQASPGALHWLDFFDDYLNEEGKLKEQYKLDGTHMSPKYVELLERELKKAPPRE